MDDVFFIWKVFKGVYQLVGEVYLSARNKRFLTIGFTGTGKTKLLTSVTKASIPDDPRNATIDTTTGVGTVGRTSLVVADTSGNPVVFDTIVRSEIEKAQSGQYLGILNVTAFGYNEGRGDRTNERHKIDVYIGESNRVNPEYLEIERQQELDFLDLWLAVAGATGDIGWVFCAINKYDLWREQESDVYSYYSPTGPYGKRIVETFGRNRYATCGACATLSNFHGRTPKMSTDYTHGDAAQLNDIFRAQLEHRIKAA